MSTIPKLNLHGSDEHTQALNRWADSVTTAFADQLSKVHATNQQAHTADAAASAASTSVTNLGNTPVVAPDPITGNMQQGSLNKLPVTPRLVSPITQDHLVDGTTYNRFKAANMYSGGLLPAHIATQLPSILTNNSTVFSGTIVLSGSGWTVEQTISLYVPPGLNSITFTINPAYALSTAGSFGVSSVGLAIYSGSAPSTPQVSTSAWSTLGTTMTITSPVSGLVTLGFYLDVTSGAWANFGVTTGKIIIPTTTPIAYSAVT